MQESFVVILEVPHKKPKCESKSFLWEKETNNCYPYLGNVLIVVKPYCFLTFFHIKTFFREQGLSKTESMVLFRKDQSKLHISIQKTIHPNIYNPHGLAYFTDTHNVLIKRFSFKRYRSIPKIYRKSYTNKY